MQFVFQIQTSHPLCNRNNIFKSKIFIPISCDINIRRIGEVSKLFVDAGLFTIAAFISPYREDRDFVSEMFKKGEFLEIYVKCSLEVCEKRDPKGLYKKARAFEIKEFTGITAPYEEAFTPEIIVNTETTSIEDCIQQLVNYLKNKHYI